MTADFWASERLISAATNRRQARQVQVALRDDRIGKESSRATCFRHHRSVDTRSPSAGTWSSLGMKPRRTML